MHIAIAEGVRIFPLRYEEDIPMKTRDRWTMIDEKSSQDDKNIHTKVTGTLGLQNLNYYPQFGTMDSNFVMDLVVEVEAILEESDSKHV
jgi:hypothetical protein